MFCWNYATVILSTPFWSKFWFLAMPPATFDERTWQVCMLEQLACGFSFSESVVVFWLTVNCESLQKRKRLNLDCRIDSFRCCINFFWWNIRIDFAWGSSVTPTFFFYNRPIFLQLENGLWLFYSEKVSSIQRISLFGVIFKAVASSIFLKLYFRLKL